MSVKRENPPAITSYGQNQRVVESIGWHAKERARTIDWIPPNDESCQSCQAAHTTCVYGPPVLDKDRGVLVIPPCRRCIGKERWNCSGGGEYSVDDKKWIVRSLYETDPDHPYIRRCLNHLADPNAFEIFGSYARLDFPLDYHTNAVLLHLSLSTLQKRYDFLKWENETQWRRWFGIGRDGVPTVPAYFWGTSQFMEVAQTIATPEHDLEEVLLASHTLRLAGTKLRKKREREA
nr:uncharacterized protein CI109_000433 [Kwoniella shandongensis]KAA5530863.1 hypothetical protein CI109_000433 [Kwoniella shandongensis]